MKQPKKLKRDYKAVARAYHCNPNNWMLVEEMGSFIKVIRKDSIGTSNHIFRFWDKHVK